MNRNEPPSLARQPKANRPVRLSPPRQAPGSAGQSIEWERRLRSATETERLGLSIGQALRGGEVIALFGELGTGKTTLVRGLAVGLGAAPRSVSSPTFVLIQEYRGRLPLAHADLYRLDSATDLHHLGLSDYLDERHVVAIEWAEKAGADLPADRLEVHLSHRSKTIRAAALKATGPSSHRLLTRLMQQEALRKDAAGPNGKEQRRP